jgi:hypothetical protein
MADGNEAAPAGLCRTLSYVSHRRVVSNAKWPCYPLVACSAVAWRAAFSGKAADD